METAKSKLLQIILVGQPELNHTLAQSAFRQLRQRINLRYHLRPLSRKEMIEYIEKRLRTAGGNTRLFSEKAIREIYRRSKGVPRLINILCDNSLLNAYALDQKQVDEGAVRETARDLKLAPKISRTWIWVILGLVAGAMALLLFRVGFPHAFELLHNKLFENLRGLMSIVAGFQEIFQFFKEAIFRG
jgi:general secretion pathway protein A